jgi:hypothetical protein
VQREHLASREHAVVGQSNQRGDVLSHSFAVAGNQLHRDAESPEASDGVGCTWFGTVEKREEPHERQISFVVSPERRLGIECPFSDREHSNSLFGPGFIAGC